MANHKSAIKEHRQSLMRRQRNRLQRSKLRTQVKMFRKALADGETDAAAGMLRATLSLIDRTARHGAIHDNAAARTKSRLCRALRRAQTAA